MTTPQSIYDYDMDTRQRRPAQARGGARRFRCRDYVTERLRAPRADGDRVPISLRLSQGLQHDGSHPTLLYGYGSYGLSIDAAFARRASVCSIAVSSIAIAHIRGGQELGRAWYDDGKLLNKKNTFTDFIACAEYLVSAAATPPATACSRMGGSAGGLLIGAVRQHAARSLPGGVVAEVPFVDVVTTMLDATHPADHRRVRRVGQSRRARVLRLHAVLLALRQRRAQAYPPCWSPPGCTTRRCSTGSRPSGWPSCATLKTDDNPLLLKTHMDAGHGGASGRFRRHQETAFSYVFLLDLAGIRE